MVSLCIDLSFRIDFDVVLNEPYINTKDQSQNYDNTLKLASGLFLLLSVTQPSIYNKEQYNFPFLTYLLFILSASFQRNVGSLILISGIGHKVFDFT